MWEVPSKHYPHLPRPALLIFNSYAIQHVQFNVFESIHSIVQSSSQSYFKTFHPSQEKPQCFASHSSFPPRPAPATTHPPLSLSLGFPFLDILYKWNQTVCSLLCPASFTWHEVFEVHPYCSICSSFLKFLQMNFSLYGHTTFYFE